MQAGSLLLALLLGACAPLPSYSRLPVVQHPSVNFNERLPSFVILHHTGRSKTERAGHAGDSWWGGPIDMNSASIGIELDNDGKEIYPEPQIAALLNLLADLKKRYAIPGINILGHGDIAPGRKVDPDINFPWRRLAQQGLGLWCEPPFDPAPPSPNAGTLLGAFGYDISN